MQTIQSNQRKVYPKEEEEKGGEKGRKSRRMEGINKGKRGGKGEKGRRKEGVVAREEREKRKRDGEEKWQLIGFLEKGK